MKYLRFSLMLIPIGAAALAISVSSGCQKAKAAVQDVNSPFKYREVYLPEGIGSNALSLGLNTLDEDWGIWGHNINRAIPEDHSQSIYAKVNGATVKKQYCFSSNHLYSYLEDYIDSKFDDDVRFAIIPNDNDIVCLCAKCVEVGNTKGDASPAVTKLVRRLADRFPNHVFFTSDYRTTQSLPKDSMPQNTGVLLSAINYPLSTVETPEEIAFIDRINAWETTTPRILVWDYINNFDDYFTPYPTLGAMQRRLQRYRDNHVSAIFLNGSGSDPSALSRLRTEVLATLTADPDAEWKEVLKEKAIEDYPTAGSLIADFMIAQEDSVAKMGISLPLYVGVETALNTYLPETLFVEFHDNLRQIKNQTSGQERDELNMLLSELALTRLELNRINGNILGAEELISELSNLSRSGYDSYNESGWTIDGYIRDYRNIIKHAKEVKGSNRLKGEKIIALTPLDPDYSNLALLTDGMLGIPSNYHNGNLITSPEVQTQLAIPNKPGMRKLKVWLSYNPGYKILLPEAVILSNNGKKIKEVKPEYPVNGNGHLPIEFDVPGGTEGTLVLTLVKEPETHSMAIEEIEGF